MLESAVEGRAVVDRELWQELGEIQTWVVDSEDHTLAAFSFAEVAREAAAELLWLHAREDHALVELCLGHFMKQAPTKALRAFSFSTPLTAGVEALPVRARPTTCEEAPKWDPSRFDATS